MSGLIYLMIKFDIAKWYLDIFDHVVVLFVISKTLFVIPIIPAFSSYDEVRFFPNARFDGFNIIFGVR